MAAGGNRYINVEMPGTGNETMKFKIRHSILCVGYQMATIYRNRNTDSNELNTHLRKEV